MGKVSAEAKKTYAGKIRVYKSEIEKILQREKSILATIAQSETPQPFKYITLADDCLNLAAHYLLLNRISISILGIKNEAFLNDSRKSCYESIIYLEKITTDQIDVPFSELDESWKALEGLRDLKRYELMCKLGFTIESVMEGFGENTKWKWSFVDLNGRYAAAVKNIINFRTLVAGLDPRVQDYQIRQRMMNKVKELLNKSADDFRLKYELSTHRIDDFKSAILFLSALRRIHTVLGEANQVEEIKKKIILWKQKMETDALKKKEA